MSGVRGGGGGGRVRACVFIDMTMMGPTNLKPTKCWHKEEDMKIIKLCPLMAVLTAMNNTINKNK